MSNKGIYKLHWDDNSYYYIGQSKDINKRFKKHLNRLSNNNHENSRVTNVFNKYGFPKLEILEFSDLSCLNALEQSYLDIHFNDKMCCNLCPTANSTQGYKHTIESLIIIGQKSKLKVFDDEYRKKLRERPVNKSMLGKKHTKETRELMSKSHIGLKLSQSHKDNISKSNKKAKESVSFRVLNTSTMVIYGSIREASRQTGIERTSLMYKIKHSKNCIFKLLTK